MVEPDDETPRVGGTDDRSIYERALGEEFTALHPKVQERFGFTSADGVACIGRGTMEYVRNGGPHLLPFLWFGATHNTMFPEENTAVPFTIRNYAYEDAFGRETVTWLRRFDMPRRRRFDAAMIYSEDRDRIIDYLGTRHHLAVDIDLAVSDRGGIEITTGPQRLYAVGTCVPLPLALSAQATVHEWYDDETEQFRIAVTVTNPLVGLVFEYRGSFEVEWIDCEAVPDAVRPVSPTAGE
ncbi:DUF4166 domain-containing protein [Haloarcula montana]|uniref:DUF4166 domain-containing protein n=1 Tax=Haloarcula montana TaxID=3111776 RepID=UPI002D797C6C|nr:DUF4166 domain-containing protein [Haloarcula sp. GH36]